MTKPTEQTYTEFQTAYDFFNKALFKNTLPQCLITMQRKNRTYGYFSGNRWASYKGDITDEIAMNPAHFKTRSTQEVLSTLAHEMVHLWQHHNGKPGRRGYHNKEWGVKMEAIGLIPSDTGEPGGHKTGEQMTHYIAKDGAFEKANATLQKKNFKISWSDRAIEGPKKKKPSKQGTRVKYTCPDCELNAWAKPEVLLICGECEEALVANE